MKNARRCGTGNSMEYRDRARAHVERDVGGLIDAWEHLIRRLRRHHFVRDAVAQRLTRWNCVTRPRCHQNRNRRRAWVVVKTQNALHAKNKTHLRRQRRRTRALLREIMFPLLCVQIVILPLVALVLFGRFSTVHGPTTIHFSSCWSESGPRGLGGHIMETNTGRQFFVPINDAYSALWDDLTHGQINPEEDFLITWFPGIYRTSIVTLTYKDRVYGDPISFKTTMIENSRGLLIIAALFFLIGLAACVLIFLSKRKELLEIRKLLMRQLNIRKGSRINNT